MNELLPILVAGLFRDLRGEAQVGERPRQDLADLQGLGGVQVAGDLAAVPVAIDRHLHAHPALLDAEIAPPGQVRGQARRGDFTFPGGTLALPIDRGLGDIIVLVRVVPHHVPQEPGRLLLGERRDRLGVVQVI